MSSDKNGEMHRLSSLPGAESNEVFTVVEQPPAPVLFLTSASTDISTLSSCLRQPGMAHWKEQLRALPLDCLRHPAQIDHYLAQLPVPLGCLLFVCSVDVVTGAMGLNNADVGSVQYTAEHC